MSIDRQKIVTIIVTFNSSTEIENCLKSLDSRKIDNVIVVDNKSTDETLELVRSNFPWVTVLEMNDNYGYASAVNQAIKAYPDADYYLILNPDIIATETSIERLIEFAESNPNCGLVGSQLLNTDGSRQSSYRTIQTPLTIAVRRTPLSSSKWGKALLANHLMLDHDDVRESLPVDWLLGACMLVRNEALQSVGLMDERFFLYFEDVDWCLRMWIAGWEVWCHTKSTMIHSHKRASAQNQWTLSRTTRLHLASAIKFFKKYPSIALSRVPSILPSSAARRSK